MVGGEQEIKGGADGRIYQSLAISKDHSNSRCFFLSSSMKVDIAV